MSVSDFLVWAETTRGLWQLRDGEPEEMDPASSRHAGIQAELTYLLSHHLRSRRAMSAGDHGRVLVAPGVTPRLRADRTMLVPDIAVTLAPPSAAHGLADPLILIEIMSPSNEAQTRANVWAFASIPSLREIVLVSSVEVTAEVLRRAPDGAWPESPDRVGPAEILRLDSVGFEIALRDAYATTDLAVAST